MKKEVRKHLNVLICNLVDASIEHYINDSDSTIAKTEEAEESLISYIEELLKGGVGNE